MLLDVSQVVKSKDTTVSKNSSKQYATFVYTKGLRMTFIVKLFFNLLTRFCLRTICFLEFMVSIKSASFDVFRVKYMQVFSLLNSINVTPPLR